MRKKSEKKISELHALFSANAKRLREAAGISQTELARLTGLTHNFIYDIEKGNKGVSFDTLGKLSKVFDVEPYQFFVNSAQCLNGDKQPFIGFIETINKKVNNIFDYSIAELTGKK